MSFDPGVVSLIVFGLMLITFCINKLPPAWVSMTGVVVCVLLGISTLPRAMSGFTNDIIFLIVGMDVLSQALLKVGLASIIGKAIIKLSKGSEKRIMLLSFCFSAIISGLINNMTIVMIFLVILRSIAKVSEDSVFNIKNVVLPVIAGIFAGAGFTLIGTAPNLVGNQIVINAGLPGFDFFSFTPVAVGIFLVCGVIIYFYQYERGKKIWSSNAETETKPNSGAEPKIEEQIKIVDIASEKFTQEINDKKKKYIMAGITVLTITLLVSGVVSLGTAALVGALLSIITGCIPEKEAFSNMKWGIIIWLAGLFSITEILNFTGGSDIIAQAALRLAPEGLPLFLVFAVVVLVAMSCSQFISDTVTVLVFLPVFLPVAIELGMNPHAMAVGIIFAANLSFLTPLASAQIGITLTVGYTFSDIFRYSWLLHLAMYITLILVIPLVFPL